MRKFIRASLCVALSAGVGVFFAGPASAGGKTEKFCEQAYALQGDPTQSTDPEQLAEDAAADLEGHFKRLAKVAPNRKIKKASKQLAAFYGEIADGDAEITSGASKKYTKAFARYSAFLVSKCLPQIPGLEDLSDLSDYEIPGS